MNGHPLGKNVDPKPLVEALIEKSLAGKLNWQATADESAFIASVGGETTLKITLKKVETFDDERGEFGLQDVPVLHMLDANGRTLWEIDSSEGGAELWALHKLAQRIGNKVDDRLVAVMEAVQKL